MRHACNQHIQEYDYTTYMINTVNEYSKPFCDHIIKRVQLNVRGLAKPEHRPENSQHARSNIAEVFLSLGLVVIDSL